MKNEFFVQGARNHILTTDELLHNAVVKLPPQFGIFKQAYKVGKQTEAEQAELGFGYFCYLSLAQVGHDIS